MKSAYSVDAFGELIFPLFITVSGKLEN